MKKILFVLLLFVLSSFAPAPEFIYIGSQKDLADTNVHELQLFNLTGGGPQTVYIILPSTNTGTIEVTIQGTNESTMPTGLYEWPAGSKIPITVIPGIRNIYVRASVATQSLVITQ